MEQVAVRWIAACALLCSVTSVQAQVGFRDLPANGDFGKVSVYYPSQQLSPVQRGTFQSELSKDAPPVQGNRRLVVISHGSCSSPRMYLDLVKQLVRDGFCVAMPEHAKDNASDCSDPGPSSWTRRPIEISHAIDQVAGDAQLMPLLDLSKVGMYGMSAGGHTALTLAGGKWSPGRLRQHCLEHASDDFHACAGLTTKLTGGVLDPLKVAVVRLIDRIKFSDDSWYSHTDARIAAIVAGVPFAADFDPESLRSPKVPLAIISARQDQWLVPAYHSDAILKVCRPCVRLADIKDGGHGALLSPLPEHPSGLLAELISDPPGFNRAAAVAEINSSISAFFQSHLLDSNPKP